MSLTHLLTSAPPQPPLPCCQVILQSASRAFFLRYTVDIAPCLPKTCQRLPVALGQICLLTAPFGAPPLSPASSPIILTPPSPMAHGARARQHPAAPRESRLQTKPSPRADLPVQTPVLVSLLTSSHHSLDLSLNQVMLSQGNLYFSFITFILACHIHIFLWLFL